MSVMSVEHIGDLVIADTEDTSTLLSSLLTPVQRSVLGTMDQLTVFGPAALTGTVTIEVSDEPDGTFVPLNDSNGAPIEIAAATATDIPFTTYKDLRLKSSGAEGDDRVFKLFGRLNLV